MKCKHLNFNCIIKKKVPTYIFESPWSLLLLQVFANFLQEHSCRNCLEINNFILDCKKYQKTLFLDNTSMVRIANDCPKIIRRFVLERGYLKSRLQIQQPILKPHTYPEFWIFMNPIVLIWWKNNNKYVNLQRRREQLNSERANSNVLSIFASFLFFYSCKNSAGLPAPLNLFLIGIY